MQLYKEFILIASTEVVFWMVQGKPTKFPLELSFWGISYVYPDYIETRHDFWGTNALERGDLTQRSDKSH